MRLRILLVMTCVLSSPLLAQKDTIFIYKGIQAKLHYGFIFAHSEAVQNTAGAHPRGIEVELIKQRNDTATWDLCHCYPTKGWNFSYFDFNTPILGQGITAAYFLQPSYKIGRE
ncbi:MAG: hypothetical protein JWQ96_1896 [Segetibacter sp.]|nr:hypothetical protein [Segetibacter sp.]